MDKAQLQSLVSTNPAARAVLTHLAERHRNWKETIVDRLEDSLAGNGQVVDRSAIIAVFRGLQQAGCGNLVLGRKGRLSRFVWTVPLVEAAKAATAESPRAEASQPEVPKRHVAESKALEHVYNLRENFQVRLELPRDLTEMEANRLGEFVKTLPFS